MSHHLEKAKQLLAENRPDAALEQIQLLYRELQKLPELPLFPAGVKAADQFLLAMGQLALEQTGPPAEESRTGRDCILASEIFALGGRALLAKDLATALHEKPELWLTKDQSPSPEAVAHAGSLRIRTFPGNNLWQKTLALVSALGKNRPRRLFLLHSPDDVTAAAVAAAGQKMGCQLYLLHHADATPCSGLFLPDCQLIDFTPRAAAFSRYLLGLESIWLPLTCPDPKPPKRTFKASGTMTTATSGHPTKFRIMAHPDYPELICSLLQATNGRHLHIGALDRKIKRDLAQKLASGKVPNDRFVHVEWVPNLARALLEYQVDLFINSYPIGGARTVVEAMAAGTPTVWQSPSPELDPIRAQMRYPQAPVWRTLDDLTRLATQFDAGEFTHQSSCARAHYERCHHPRIWQENFNTSALKGISLPESYDANLIIQGILANCLERRQGDNFRWRLRERLVMSKRRRKFILNHSL